MIRYLAVTLAINKKFLLKLLQIGKNKIIILLLYLFVFTQLFAQDYNVKKLDSLKKVAYKSVGKNKVDCFNTISEIYWSLNLDSSIYYGNAALKIAQNINYETGIANAHSKLTGSFFYLSDFSNTLKHAYKALALFKKLGDKENEGTVLTNIAIAYIYMGIFEKALDYNIKALKIYEDINDTLGIAYAYISNAFIYNSFGMTDKSLSLNLKALKLFQILNNLSLVSTTMNNIGSYYSELNKPDSAKYYELQALKIAKSINNLLSIAKITDNIGRRFSVEGKYDSAIVYHHQAIDLYNKWKTDDVSSPYLSLASLYLQVNKMDSAKYYLDKAYKIIIKSKNFQNFCDVYKLYNGYYEKTNNIPKAFDYYRLYTETKDSILSEKTRNRLIDYQIDYETEKLRTENEIQALKINQSKNQRNFLMILTVLILILTIVSYSRFILKKQTNKLLTEKNIELENINKIKDRFFAIIAHDLKNQLTAFQNISNVLKENYDKIGDDKKHEFIIKINEASNSLYEVLENLLTWSSSQIKGIEFEPKYLNLNELAKKVLGELKLTAEKKDIFIKNEIPTDILVWADENMVRNVIRNLVNNSIKFSDEKTEVLIASVKKDNMVEISVIDQGIGISDDDKEKLFKLDVDFKKIGSHKNKGTGLGLIISKAFIEKMKGNIWISDNFERGCIFSFSLPIYAS